MGGLRLQQATDDSTSKLKKVKKERKAKKEKQSQPTGSAVLAVDEHVKAEEQPEDAIIKPEPAHQPYVMDADAVKAEQVADILKPMPVFPPALIAAEAEVPLHQAAQPVPAVTTKSFHNLDAVAVARRAAMLTIEVEGPKIVRSHIKKRYKVSTSCSNLCLSLMLTTLM